MAKPAAAGGAAAAPDKKGKKKTFKKKERKHVPHGLVYVQASFNNTIVTITDMNGNVLSWKSSGSLGFRGSRKGTPFAAQQAASNAANMARDHGVRTVDVRVSGPGSGRESAVRALAAAGLEAARVISAVIFGTLMRRELSLTAPDSRWGCLNCPVTITMTSPHTKTKPTCHTSPCKTF